MDGFSATYGDVLSLLRQVHSKLRKRLLRSVPDTATLDACADKLESAIATLRRQGQTVPEAVVLLSVARVHKARGDFLSEAKAYCRAGELFLNEELRRYAKGSPSRDADLSRGVMASYFATRGFAAHGDELCAFSASTQCAVALQRLGCADAAVEYWEAAAAQLAPAATAASLSAKRSQRGPRQQVPAIMARRTAFREALRSRDFAKAQVSGQRLLDLLYVQQGTDGQSSPRGAPEPHAEQQQAGPCDASASGSDDDADVAGIEFSSPPPRDFLGPPVDPFASPMSPPGSKPSGKRVVEQLPGFAARLVTETQLRLLLTALVQKDTATARMWLTRLEEARAASPSPAAMRLLTRIVDACAGDDVWGHEGPHLIRLLCRSLASAGVADPAAWRLAGTLAVVHTFPASLPPPLAPVAPYRAAVGEVTV